MFNPWQSLRKIFRGRQFKKLTEDFKDLFSQDAEAVETVLEVLLGVVSLALWLDKDYHRNILGFEKKYLFQSKDKELSVCAIFKRTYLFKYNYLKVSEGTIEDADITVTFKDSKALINLFPNLDVLAALLRNDVTVKGNVNCIFKFGFMATQLQQMLLSWV